MKKRVFTWLTDKEQEEILAWEEAQREKLERITDRVERAMAHALHAFGILKIGDDAEKARVNAEKAWKTAQKINASELRAKAAAAAAYKMDVKDE